MSIRFRRSMKIMPGVRLNFNKNSLGLSLGIPGAHYTMNTNGRRTISAGIPGTGLSSVQVLSSGRSSSNRGNPSQLLRQSDGPPAPGLFASKAEREFNSFVKDIYGADGSVAKAQEVIDKAVVLRAKFPELKTPLELISYLHGISEKATSDQATAWGDQIWPVRATMFGDKLVSKYFRAITPKVPITRGISTDGIYDEQTFGFIYAEVLQGDGKYSQALDVLSELDPDQLVGMSIADIEIAMGDFDGAIETTDDIENEDDATAMMLILRGIAFREKGLSDAALECFKRAIAKKARSEEVIHRGLFERATTYIKVGKKAAARKDLEKILVDDPKADGVDSLLKSF